MSGSNSPHARDLEDAPDWSKYPDKFGNPSPPTVPNMNLVSVQSVAPADEGLSHSKASELARECYDASTNWINASRRGKWSDSLRMFQNQHPSGSKYTDDSYKYRSKLFRPKTRSMVRKDEAQTAAAFFANEDVLSIRAEDDDDPRQQASAEIMQELLQYRLTRTIPWFLTVCGGRQDADVQGICFAKVYWRYAEKLDRTERRPVMDALGQQEFDDDGIPSFEDYDVYLKTQDHPWVDLVAPENMRFDPGADWRNPIATSPYLIQLIPVYVSDAREYIRKGDWLPVSDSSLFAATDLDDDTTRRAREQGRVPGKDDDAWKPHDYTIAWIHENIIRITGENGSSRDWHYLTLGNAGELLTEPKPLEEVYLQGIRPYVSGFVIPEAHKTYPSGKVELTRDLQSVANTIMNSRIDNVNLALQPRQIIAEGKGVDANDARTFMPAKVLFTKNPREDIVWDRPPDVTASAYQEQERIDLDFDNLTGDISNASIQANRQLYEAVGNMQMMQGNASQVAEYEQRVFAETFVEPILRHLVKLEQAYETDPVILAIAGKRAQLFQKYGINQIDDQLLKQELTIKVNVGIGATNPQTKLKNMGVAAQMMQQIFGPVLATGLNFEEIAKEIFSSCGYKDGMRFFMPGFDYQKSIQQMSQAMSQKGAKGPQTDPGKVQAAQISAQGRIQEATIDAHTQQQSHAMELQRQMLEEKGETMRVLLNMKKEMEQMKGGHWMDMQKMLAPKPMSSPTNGMSRGERNPTRGAAPALPPEVISYDNFGNRKQSRMH